jgi:large subunit ribosomal protein L4
MELSVVDIKGKDTGKKINLPEDIFGVTPNDHVIYLDVKQYLANQRQGTHKSKQRNEVSGTTKKLKKQKGTGGARAGSMKSPVFVGGGRIFGPQPRDYSFKINKKTKVLARKSALSYKATDNAISILDKLVFSAPKTKEYISVMSNLSLSDKKTLVVLESEDHNVYMSSRNIKNTKVVLAEDINTYDVLHADNLVLTLGALEKIQGVLN